MLLVNQLRFEEKTMLHLLFGIFSASAQAEPPVYKLKNGGMSIRVYKSGVLSKVAHNHVVEAVSWMGSAAFDPAKPESCKIAITVVTNKLRVDAPRARNRIKEPGFDSIIGEENRKKIKENMFDEGQLNVSKYPEIKFLSTSCKKTKGKYTINGKFTLRGVSRNISVTGAKVVVKDGGIHIIGNFSIKATDYGFKPYRALGGAISNKNTMKVVFGLKGKKQ